MKIACKQGDSDDAVLSCEMQVPMSSQTAPTNLINFNFNLIEIIFLNQVYPDIACLFKLVSLTEQ